MKLLGPVHWSARLLVPIALLLGGLLCIHYVGKIQSLFEHGSDTAIAGGKAEAKSHEAFVQRQNQLAAAAARARTVAQRLAKDTSTLRASRDSALAAALALTAQLDSARGAILRRAVVTLGEACSAEVVNCAHRADSLAAADSTDRLRADEATVRALHADSLLAPLTHAANCRWLGIGFMPKCLSRAQSFVAGAGLVGALKLVGIIK